MRRFEEAETSYREAIKLNPNYAKAYSNLGMTLDRLGRFEEAETSYREAIKLNPNYADAYSNLGVTLSELGRFEESEASFREAIKLNPKDAEAYYNLGYALGRLGRFEEAETSYREAIKLNPNYAEAHANLGMVLFKKNLKTDRRTTDDFDEAKLHFGKARNFFTKRDVEKDVALMKAYLSWIDGFTAWRVGKLKEAEKCYVSASELFSKAKRDSLALSLNMVIEFIANDKEYVDCINSRSLTNLKEGITHLNQKIQKSLHDIKKLHDSPAEVEMVYARAMCIEYLAAALLFAPVKVKQLEATKSTFLDHDFIPAYRAANAIGTFTDLLKHFCPNKSFNEISKEKEEILLAELKQASLLDGIITQRFARGFAESFKPEFYSAISTVAESIKSVVIEEGTKTREAFGRDIVEVKERLDETKELSQKTLAIAQQNPERVQALLNEQLDELRQILVETANQLKDTDPQKASEAKRWYNYLAQGISVAADLIQIFSFITGIQSMPTLENSDIPTRILEYFKRLRSKVIPFRP